MKNRSEPSRWAGALRALAAAAVVLGVGAPREAGAQQQRRPNILVIFGDDIGPWNTSIYNQGMMGYRTPNIDRIGREGARFTDAYGQQSCTAGRAAFITGQSPVRTGLTKVGLPGAKEGISAEDPTLAELLKPLGYRTGQFGKNHLGDRDEHLPTAHGFDEFFGNLYHLNAEEEPEHPDYPKDPGFRKRFGPRGVLRARAGGRVEDTGPLTRKRMETIDEELLAATEDFLDRAKRDKVPFFVWFNTTRMHVDTHLKPGAAGKTGLGVYPDGMVEHDGHVGRLLEKLERLGFAGDTIVIYTTDNGAEVMSWPDGGTTPFRGEKNTNWEGGYRVPLLVRWPGVFKPGTVINEVVSHEDWLPTLLAAAGDANVKEELLKGLQAGGKSFKVHLDGYDMLPFFQGKARAPRNVFFSFNDDGALVALRYTPWKLVFREQRAHGFDVWQEPFVPLRLPMLFNVRTDPFERAEESWAYGRWRFERLFLLVPAQAYCAWAQQSMVGPSWAQGGGRDAAAGNAPAAEEAHRSCLRSCRAAWRARSDVQVSRLLHDRRAGSRVVHALQDTVAALLRRVARAPQEHRLAHRESSMESGRSRQQRV
jgi:arylsulfatase A-like enzyme